VERCVAAIAIAILAAGGCATIFAVKGQQRLADTNCIISGTVATEKPARGPLIVGLFQRNGDDYVLVDYFTPANPARGSLACNPEPIGWPRSRM